MHNAYPNHGWHWLARSNKAELFLSSDDCDSAEQAAINRTENQTAGEAVISPEWPYGLEHYVHRCDGVVTMSTDVKLDYMTPTQWYSTHGTYTGHVHSYKAPSSYCDYWNISYPCGNHGTRMHLNRDRLNGFSSTTQRNILMHELTHVHGFKDVCSNNVTLSSNCDYDGIWYDNDLSALLDHIYPNWRY